MFHICVYLMSEYNSLCNFFTAPLSLFLFFFVSLSLPILFFLFLFIYFSLFLYCYCLSSIDLTTFCHIGIPGIVIVCWSSIMTWTLDSHCWEGYSESPFVWMVIIPTTIALIVSSQNIL